jgi:hypothetical protein
MIKSSWAVLRCKFNDNLGEPFTDNYYQDLFTASGIGSQNMVDFFGDVSHGNVDLSDSKVFGWYILNMKRNDYLKDLSAGINLTDEERSDIINRDRNALFTLARQAAAANGDDLLQFASVVVCFNIPTDLFGGGNGVVCDSGSTDPRFLGQEMGHFYGLDHSRADTIKPCGNDFTADYKDFWDIMSTAACAHSAAHPKYQFIGPALNAANMESLGWLDESRVWQSDSKSFDTFLQLRPLHRRNLPGYLAARIGKYLVEFRMNEVWDAGIPRPAVLIHRFDDTHSYIMSANNGDQDLITGSVFGTTATDNSNLVVFAGATKIEVVEINADEKFAKIRLVQLAAFEEPSLSGFLIGGADKGGNGLLFVGGKFVPVPPHSPFVKVLEQIATYQSSDAITSVHIRDIVRKETLSSINLQVQNQMQKLRDFKQPASIQQAPDAVSPDAGISKICPSGFVYLVPGRISLNNNPVFSASPPAEEEITVDAMTAMGVATATYTNLVVTLTLFEPDGCEFLLADEDLRPNDITWNFPIAGDNTTIQAVVIPDTPQTLNRGNSKSFRFAIRGRAGRNIKVEIFITAQPVSVAVDSCNWIIDGLNLDTTNLGKPLDETSP